MATTYLTRTQTAGNQKTWTLSVWFKRSTISVTHIMPWCAGTYTSTNLMQIYWDSGDTLNIHGYDSGATNTFALQTNRVLRDTSGWYNLVVACDTTQAIDTNRLKIYINGVQETSLATTDYPALNLDTGMNENTIPLVIGNRNGASYYFSGLMSHLHIIDGTAYPASTFGSTNADTGEWVINTAPSVTYGTNGAFILEDGNSVTDQSGEGNNFTVGGGTLTATEDNPSDVFATFNSLYKTGAVLSNANTTGANTQGEGSGFKYISGVSTLGMLSNKTNHYAEFKLVSETTGESLIGIGGDIEQIALNIQTESGTGWFGIRNDSGTKYYNGSATTSTHDNFTTGDIIGVAFDTTNKKLTFSKNGGWWNGTGTWTGTSPDTITYYVDCTGGSYNTFYFYGGVSAGQSTTTTWSVNFGNGYFGTTAISSEGTNASGIGKFEYDVPTGYTALSTKGMNS